jgi:diaminohydroxyphosphoribosylaminopyrimidine deaminase/5-amino-6-(5-phosphoribosylamino)uracil reductase
MSIDELHMFRALALAERGRGRTSPNPVVGAVVVDDEGVVVGRGSHEVAGGPHAEVYALDEAGTRARGATLYCTLEPCSHTGRTGPCAPKVVEAGIRRVVVATEDPNPLVAGRGIALLRTQGISVTVGVCAEAAHRLNPPFFTWIRQRRPFVTVKAALTLDGCVAAFPGVRTELTGAAANRFIHRERAEIDAIGVGSGTVLADNPRLTPRGAYRYRPLMRVVFDRRLRTPLHAALLSTTGAGPVIIMSTTTAARETPERLRSLGDAGARVELVDPDAARSSFLPAALERLGELGCLSMVVEGGPTVHSALWTAGLVDRVELFVTPAIAGPGGLRWDVLPVGTMGSLAYAAARPVGEDMLIEGHVHRSD